MKIMEIGLFGYSNPPHYIVCDLSVINEVEAVRNIFRNVTNAFI